MCLSGLSLEFRDLLRRDPHRPVVRNTRASQQRGEQIALISLRIREVSSCPDRTAALSGNHKGEVFTSVYVPILQPRSPHHDAVVEQRAVALPQVRHLRHHVGKLPDVEFGDHGDLANLHGIVVVVGVGVMLVGETQSCSHPLFTPKD